MRYAGPREALFHALVRKNYGINQPDRRPRPRGRRQLLRPLRRAADLRPLHAPRSSGVTPLKFEPTFFCHACDALASPRTCPHDAASRLELSGTKVREILREGGRLPAQVHAARGRGDPARALLAAGAAAPRRPRGRSRAGGLHRLVHRPLRRGQEHARPGAAAASSATQRRSRSSTATRCAPTCRRASASRKEDRDTNIRRIGYVARLLARNGVAAITAAISPYARDPRRGAPARRRRTASPSSRCSPRRRLESPDRARREGPLQEGARRRDRSTSPASPIPTSRRTAAEVVVAAPTGRRSRRALAASSWRSRSAGCSTRRAGSSAAS